MGKAAKKKVDTNEEEVGQAGDVNISVTGDAKIDKPTIEKVDGPDAMSRAEEMAFMEEPVTIVVHESTDPNAENPIKVSVNGRNQFFFRGEPVTVKRKFVERLARAKKDSYTQPNLGSSDPQMYNRLRKNTGLQYPFSVIEDSNPGQGADWLRKILKEAQ